MSSSGGDKSKQEELLVFGYACKLFRDDERALYIDSGKHLIPWMADETLKIDRYDGRGALFDLRQHEPPSGGFDRWHGMTDRERKLEEMVDQERYMALHKDVDEERMLEEEEWKRLQAAGAVGSGAKGAYNQMAFNYDSGGGPGAGAAAAGADVQEETAADKATEPDDEPYQPPLSLNVPDGMAQPQTQRHADIIERTAHFVARQGPQMEILIKAKQADNTMFNFLAFDDALQPFFRHMVVMIKAGRYTVGTQRNDEKESSEPYLHPALNLSRPDIAPGKTDTMYQPSGNCTYQLLIKNIRSRQAVDSPAGSGTSSPVPTGAGAGSAFATAPREDATRTDSSTASPAVSSSQRSASSVSGSSEASDSSTSNSDAEKRPSRTEAKSKRERRKSDRGRKSPERNVQLEGTSRKSESQKEKHTTSENETAQKVTEHTTDSQNDGPVMKAAPTKEVERPKMIPLAASSAKVPPPPPPEAKLIIDKMASYVAKNGRDFEGIVMGRGDPRFSFLKSTHAHHAYYRHKLEQYERDLGKAPPPAAAGEGEETERHAQPTQAAADLSKPTPVSFCIRSNKEKESMPLEKSALPMEDSDEDEADNTEAQKSSEAAVAAAAVTAVAAPASVAVVVPSAPPPTAPPQKVTAAAAAVSSKGDTAKRQSRQTPLVAPAPGVGRDEIQQDRKRRAAQFLAKLRQDVQKVQQPMIGPQLPDGPLPTGSDTEEAAPATCAPPIGLSAVLRSRSGSVDSAGVHSEDGVVGEARAPVEDEDSGDEADLDKYKLVESDAESPHSVPDPSDLAASSGAAGTASDAGNASENPPAAVDGAKDAHRDTPRRSFSKDVSVQPTPAAEKPTNSEAVAGKKRSRGGSDASRKESRTDAERVRKRRRSERGASARRPASSDGQAAARDRRRRKRKKSRSRSRHHRRRKRRGGGGRASDSEAARSEREPTRSRSRSPRRQKKRKKRTRSPPASYKRALASSPARAAATRAGSRSNRAEVSRSSRARSQRVLESSPPPSPRRHKQKRKHSSKHKHKGKKSKHSKRSGSRTRARRASSPRRPAVTGKPEEPVSYEPEPDEITELPVTPPPPKTVIDLTSPPASPARYAGEVTGAASPCCVALPSSQEASADELEREDADAEHGAGDDGRGSDDDWRQDDRNDRHRRASSPSGSSDAASSSRGDELDAGDSRSERDDGSVTGFNSPVGSRAQSRSRGSGSNSPHRSRSHDSSPRRSRSREDISPSRSHGSNSPHPSEDSTSRRQSQDSNSPHRSRDSTSRRQSQDSNSPHRSQDSTSRRQSQDSNSPHRSRGSTSPRPSRSQSQDSNSSDRRRSRDSHSGTPPRRRRRRASDSDSESSQRDSDREQQQAIARLKQKLGKRTAGGSCGKGPVSTNGAAVGTAPAPATAIGQARSSSALVQQMAAGLKAKVAEMMRGSLLGK